MDIAIIGSGNVATVLGGKMVMAGHRITQVIGRSPESARRLAMELNCPFSVSINEIRLDADIYVIALTDSALALLATTLSLPGKLVVHTAGAMSRDVLSDVSERTGVLYPLQSLRKEIRPFPAFPLLVDAANATDLETLESLAHSLSGQVEKADDPTRLKLHLSAIVVNNFTNYLYILAADFCQKEQIDFSLLLPLIRETSRRLEQYPPEAVQTGPAIRRDRLTIEKHLLLLHNYKDINSLYDLFTAQIEQYFHVSEKPKV